MYVRQHNNGYIDVRPRSVDVLQTRAKLLGTHFLQSGRERR
jgi:hypothetical protein